jgi:hypothetical protein
MQSAGVFALLKQVFSGKASKKATGFGANRRNARFCQFRRLYQIDPDLSIAKSGFHNVGPSR